MKRLISLLVLMIFCSSVLYSYDFSSYAIKLNKNNKSYLCFDLQGAKFVAHQELHLKEYEEKYSLCSDRLKTSIGLNTDYRHLVDSYKIKLQLCKTNLDKHMAYTSILTQQNTTLSKKLNFVKNTSYVLTGISVSAIIYIIILSIGR